MATPKVANKRLGNNVISALEDILALAKDGRRDAESAAKEAAKLGQTNNLLSIIKITNLLADIERLAIYARQGKYEG